ncbi:MAG: AAA family ATPase [Pseudomonadota bacterium]
MTDIALSVNDDLSRGLLRLSRPTLSMLNLRPGDTVAVEADARTFGRVVPADLDDGAALADPWLARNAGAPKGGSVRLSPVELPQLSALVLRNPHARPVDPERLKDGLFEMALSVGDEVPLGAGSNANDALEVVDASPRAAGIVAETTVLTVQAEGYRALGYEGLGGLEDEIARVHEMIAAPLLRPDLFKRLGLSAPRGVLFSGPPGSGKTLLARAVAGRTKAAFFHLNAPEIVTKHYGESEAALRKTFKAAERASPAIVFIDEIDAIAPSRGALSGEKQVERRIVAQLLTLLDGLSDRGQVVVMAATNLPDALDPALRRPGRFDREIKFRAPSRNGRADILKVHLSNTPLADDVDLAAIAKVTHGYVGADLAALAREAAMAALARTVAAAGGEGQVQLDALFVQQSDLRAGLDATGPSVLRGDESDAAPVDWEDIGGLDTAKDALEQTVVAPMHRPEVYAEFGVCPPTGILLSGPPGTGKTLLARALAAKAGMNFIPVRPPRLLSQYFGEAERAVAELFARARQTAPSLLFFDEFDALAPARGADTGVVDRIVGQLLVELDGLAANTDLVVLAATNRPGVLDPALVRPGRFDTVIEVPLPDRSARRAILGVHLGDKPCADEIDIDAVADATDGFSGADLAGLVETAARAAVARVLDGTDPQGLTDEDLARAHQVMVAARDLRTVDHLQTGELA